MLNSRRAAAGRRFAPIFLALPALAIVIFLGGRWLMLHQPAAQPGRCEGYGGLPSLTTTAGATLSEQDYAYCLNAIPELQISVKNRYYVQLQTQRLQAISKGVLVSDDNSFVPAHIQFNGRMIAAQLRLKGDWMDHVYFPTGWSFRVLLSGTDYLLGRQQFNLQSLKVDGYDLEPLYTRQLRQLGFMTLRYQPVRVIFNGADWGVMAIEDHFTKELIEAHQLKESVIGRFDEAAMWQHRYNYPEFGPYDNVFINEYRNYGGYSPRTQAALYGYGRRAASMIAAWQEGRVALSQIVDQARFADFIIATEAWYGWHAFRWHNMRFYYNPYTAKLEPVPYDHTQPLADISQQPAQSFAAQIVRELMLDQSFLELLLQRIKPLVANTRSKARQAELAQYQQVFANALAAIDVSPTVDLSQLADNYLFLHRQGSEFFSRQKQPPQVLVAQADDLQWPSLVKISAYSDGRLRLASKLPFAVEVQSISVRRDGARTSVALDAPITLAPTWQFQRPNSWAEIITEPLPANAEVTVTARYPTTGQEVQDRSSQVLDFLSAQDIAQAYTPPSALPAFVQRSEQQWLVPAGDWQVTQPLLPPPGVSLTFAAGAKVQFGPQAYILCRGPLHLNGSPDAPVILSAVPGQTWGGIYVLDATTVSQWQHADISGQREFAAGAYALTGANTFYRSAAQLQQVSIHDTQAEDVLNTVHARFDSDGLTIARTTSDALDADYAYGSITRADFSAIGGDALDISGSVFSGSDWHFSNVGDKAISAGEASSLRFNAVRVETTGVGVAAKDYSVVNGADISVAGARLAAFMAYSKKPEYGGAYLSLQQAQSQGEQTPALVQLGSVLELNGEPVAGRPLNIDYFYQTGLMPK